MRPDVRAHLTTVLDETLDQKRLQDLIEERALAHDAMDSRRLRRVRESMERAEARRLQPHYVESFFKEAFGRLGGAARQREPRRYEIARVPSAVRAAAQRRRGREPVLSRYERVVFEKEAEPPPGKPAAAFVCPGHPLLERPECAWITAELEQAALGHAVSQIAPEHATEVRTARVDLVDRTEAAVKDRLTKEINYWDHRAQTLKAKAGATLKAKSAASRRTGTRLAAGEAAKRADMLQARLKARLEALKQERLVSSLPPVVLGGVLVAPKGLLDRMAGQAEPAAAARTADTQAAAARARAAVMNVERDLGFEPVDREFDRLGYDIESLDPATGGLRFIEVKGRVAGAPAVTVTRNEILTSLNKPDDYVLALVEFRDDGTHEVRYLRRPFKREPDFGVTSVNYDFAELLERAGPPS